MAKELKIRITGDASDLKKGTDDAEGILKGFGGKVSAFSVASGQLLAQGIATGVGAAAGLIGDSISGAVDMAETESKVGVLFGDQTADVMKFAENSATAFGQSKQEALDAAATFATFGKAAGLSGDELEKFSTDFVGLSSDLASFNNTSPEQATEALGAALRGESEPLRAYGVLLDDATLRQKALELGIVSSTKDALTPQQKVLAAQKAIWEQTGAAQGDFARTSDGLANKQRILAAQFTNLKTEIGSAFLPLVLDLVSAFSDKVLPVLTKFGPIVAEKMAGGIREAVAWFQRLSDVFKAEGWKGALMSVATDLGQLGQAIGQWFSGTLLPLVGGWLLELGKKFGTWVTETAVPYLLANLPEWITAFYGWYYGTALPWLGEQVWELAKKLGQEWIPAAVDYLGANLPIWSQRFDDWMTGTALPWLAAKGIELARKLSDWVLDAGNYLLQNLPVWIGRFDKWMVTDGIPKVIKIGGDLAAKFIGAMADLGTEMVRMGAEVIQGLIDGMLSMAGDLVSAATGLAGSVAGAVGSALKISSPSRVMMELGRMSAQGFALGLGGSTGMVSSAATSLARAALPGYSPAELSGGSTVGSLGEPGVRWQSRSQEVVLAIDGKELARASEGGQTMYVRSKR